MNKKDEQQIIRLGAYIIWTYPLFFLDVVTEAIKIVNCYAMHRATFGLN
jgi:hypothetical protein